MGAAGGDEEHQANQFDGKISAFPSYDGGERVDLEVILVPGLMADLEIVDCVDDWLIWEG